MSARDNTPPQRAGSTGSQWALRACGRPRYSGHAYVLGLQIDVIFGPLRNKMLDLNE